MRSLSDPSLRLAVVICTHNPRPAYLSAVLEALRQQRLDRALWDLLVVDNASPRPLQETLDLGWHPGARIVREEELGLTRARLRGVTETTAPVLVFVDDDNVLSPDFLQVALQLADCHPSLGVWSGRVELDFEESPPSWTRKYWPFLAYRPVERDELSESKRLEEPLPVGAGLCIRREAALAYAAAARKSALRLNLDRRGANLSSAGDTDMVMATCAAGWQRGVFQRLQLRHLIPPERLTEEYLAQLVEEVQYSGFLVQLLNHSQRIPRPINAWWRIKYVCDLGLKFGRKRRFFRAAKNAQRRARELYEELIRSGVPNQSLAERPVASLDSTGGIT